MASNVRPIALSVSPQIGIKASTAASVAPASGVIQLLFAVGLLFISGAFTLPLAFSNTHGFVGSAVLQGVTALTGITGVLLIVTSRNARRLVIRCWPILALVALAFLSSTWSFKRISTIHESFTFLTTVLFALAMVGRLPPIQCIRLVLRMMVIGCVLSIVWVVAYPEFGIHQLTDLNQTEHAGQWRGIFSHKQGLGLFSGLTAGLLMFYGSVAFRSPISIFAGIICAVVCLVGAESTTGFLTMTVSAAVLYFFYGVVSLERQVRNFTLNLFLFAIICVYLVWSYGFLNFVPVWLGKTSDLTGRLEYWRIGIEVFRNSGVTLLGGGYGVGIQHMFPEYVYVDNGYYGILFEFGYLGSIPIAIFAFWLLLTGKSMILRTSYDRAICDVFPMAMTIVFGFVNISETNFLAAKHISVIFTVLALAIIIQKRRPAAVRRQRALKL